MVQRVEAAVRRPRLVAAVVMAVVAVQLAVPLRALAPGAPPVPHLAWHMYVAPITTVHATATVDGRTEEIDLAPVVADMRPEIDYVPLAAHLCQVRPDADAVALRRSVPRLEVRTPC